MEIKFTDVLILITGITTVLYFFSSHNIKSIKEYSKTEIDNATRKSFTFLNISIYLIPFLITAFLSLLLYNKCNISMDTLSKFFRITISLVLVITWISPFLGHIFHFKHRVKKRIRSIFYEKNIYDRDEVKYYKWMNRAHKLLITCGTLHGLIAPLFIQIESPLSFQNILVSIFLIYGLIIILYSLSNMMVYAITYKFEKYRFVTYDGISFKGYLIAEDAEFFVIKQDKQRVQFIKKDVIRGYECLNF
ncbi:hypothetical protein J416_08257 [Gracilibacillus halophilus YIM-C55.5]|uniref:Uncharacterized protein n=1 Tax=Gracilibacillus halophilus YIM-C55.5 TaxID=1308866 RepID=N4WR21_9BACI|nr:hypothetical protein [Gracilibacillus halophilus]ENH96890.1 hypothetical protein J416_08257 [Gracilibacillus halophilus YIM-C55.5]